jgi:type II secretory pathway pseudopilin PulG
MVELAIAIVIVGILAAVAVPRLSRAHRCAKASALLADARGLQLAVEHYAAEHLGRSPAHNSDGTISADAVLFANRLLMPTDDGGNPGATGMYGPYLRFIPLNVCNGQSTIRIGGMPGGTGAAGWHFDPVRQVVCADDSPATAQATLEQMKTSELVEAAGPG